MAYPSIVVSARITISIFVNVRRCPGKPGNTFISAGLVVRWHSPQSVDIQVFMG